MAKLTLLEMTQSILSGLDSDEVNSISDTVESMQVARVIQNKYYDVMARSNLPAQQVLLQLDASTDITQPTLMYIPSGVTSIDWIKYFDANPNDSQQTDQFGAYSHGVNTDIVSSTNWSTSSVTSVLVGTGSKTFTVASSGLSITVGQGAIAQSGVNSMFGTVTSYSGTTLVLNITSTSGSGTLTPWTISNSDSISVPGYKYVTMLSIEQFLDMVNSYNPADSDVNSYTFTEGANSFTFYYTNDKQPKYCTIIENRYVLFDSYDHTYDDTLQASKILAFGTQLTPFQLVDSFIPDLDDEEFPLLLNEAKALAFYELKQMPHAKAEQEIKRQWNTVQKNKSILNRPSSFDQLPNFGRMPKAGGYSRGGAYRWMRQAGQ